MKKQTMKLRAFAVLLTLIVSMLAVGCAEESNSNIVIGGNNTSSESTEDNNSGESLSFVYNNVKITPNALVDPLISAIGSEYEYFESPSCAYIGMDKCYVYKGFSIYTYPDDKAVDHVLQVILTDDSIGTPEGIIIGDSAAKVIEVYGDNYDESDGSYAYTSGKTSLMFIIKNDTVISIQYCYTDGLYQ